MPLSLIEIGEAEEIRVMPFNSCPGKFNFEIMVQTKESDEPIAAENGRNRDVAGAFQPLLEVLIPDSEVGPLFSQKKGQAWT